VNETLLDAEKQVRGILYDKHSPNSTRSFARAASSGRTRAKRSRTSSACRSCGCEIGRPAAAKSARISCA
jgi:hypothetical protein